MPSKSLPAIFAALVLALSALLLAPRAAAASDLLPDLVQKPPTQVQIGGSSASGWQIGFQSEVMNKGAGALEIHGHGPGTPGSLMTADQVIYQSGGGTRTVPGVGNLHYETGFGHQHWHFEPFDHYELRTLAGSLVGTDEKQGFCLGDNQFEGGPGPHHYGFTTDTAGYCKQNQPDATTITEGISVGWGDPYDPLKEGQDIPIDQTTVPAGDYNLVHRVNENSDGTPEAVLEESFANDVASAWVRIAWSGGTPSITVLDTCTSTASCGPVPPPPPAPPPAPGGGSGSGSGSGTGSTGQPGSTDHSIPSSGVLASGPVRSFTAALNARHVLSIRYLKARGLRMRVHCSMRCRARVGLHANGGVPLGHRSLALSRAGSRLISLRLSGKARRMLSHYGSGNFTIWLHVASSDGQRQTLERTLTLR